MPRALLTLLAVLAILAGGPAHEWLHHAELVEAHGEDLGPSPGSGAHDDDCVQCATSRVALAAPGGSAVVEVVTPLPEVRGIVRAAPPARPWSSRVQGPRAPPVKG